MAYNDANKIMDGSTKSESQASERWNRTNKIMVGRVQSGSSPRRRYSSLPGSPSVEERQQSSSLSQQKVLHFQNFENGGQFRGFLSVWRRGVYFVQSGASVSGNIPFNRNPTTFSNLVHGHASPPGMGSSNPSFLGTTMIFSFLCSGLVFLGNCFRNEYQL